MKAKPTTQDHYHRNRNDHGLRALGRRTALYTVLSLCVLGATQNVRAATAEENTAIGPQSNAVAPQTDANQSANGASAPSTSNNKKNSSKPKTTQLDTVTVSAGLVGSLNRSIDAKRSETVVVDAISAEDVGKFPDTNLAESLQHVTGVEITRDGNGEGQYVTVRGLPTDFTLTTFNGMPTTSVDLGQRTFDYNLLSPDFVSALKVYKTSRADLDEGGIAANVDIQTITPFEIGKEQTLFTAKMQGNPGGTENRNEPNLTALYSNLFDDKKFGITVGFDWNKRFYLNQSSDESPFYPVTINGKGPYYAYSETGYSNSPAKVDTKTGYVSLQWKPVDSTTATLDGFYAHRDKYYVTSDFGVVPLEPFGQPTYDGPNADYTADQNNVLTRLSTPAVAYTFYNTDSDERSAMKNLKLNFDTQLDNWEFSETAQYSGSRDHLQWVRPLLIDSTVGGQSPSPDTPIFGGYTIDPGAQVQGYVIDPSFNVSDASQWANQQFKDSDTQGTDRLKSIQADISRYFDDGVVESVKFGAKAYERSRTYDSNFWVYAFPAGSTENSFATAEQYPSWTNNVLSNYSGAGYLPSQLFFINPTLWINQHFGSLSNFQNNPDTIYSTSPSNNWDMIERGRAAYAMANFKFDAGVPITGNIGVRYVDTAEQFLYNSFNLADVQVPQNCVIGTAGCEALIYPPNTRVSDRGASHGILPSLNVMAALTDDMDLRFATSKTISLPTIDSMVPVPTVSLDSFQITEGNSNLKPFSSINEDLSWEWYFRQSSMVSLALYNKQIHGFIQEGSSTYNLDGYNFVVNLPVNGSDGYVRGIEADYKQAFDFLPSFWSGFGFEVNGTFSQGQQDAAPQYNIIATDFTGLSKRTYNTTLFYEKYGFSGVITVNHRGQYLSDQNVWGEGTTELIGDARTQVDMQAQYQLTKYLSVFLDAKNVFNKPIVYSEVLRNGPSTKYPGTWQDSGRQVMLGVTLKY
jgi:iron complex outermembrane receptor protein